MNQGMPYAEVAFPIPARILFTYKIPQTLSGVLRPGCRVYAPFGNRSQLGFVARLLEEPSSGLKEIKPIAQAIDTEPLFGHELLRFLNWTADYYLASLGETYEAAYPFSAKTKPRMVKVVVLDDAIQESGALPDTITGPAQKKVVEYLINRKALLSPGDIMRELGVSPGTIKSLEKNGLVQLKEKESQRIPIFSYKEAVEPHLVLTDEQAEALTQIGLALQQKSSKPILLHGITGSGKTEVYLQAIQKTLEQNQNALVLIPEISLTPQTMDRFRSRFGGEVGILHSALGQGERYDEWRMSKNGRRRIVVGTRSAIFAPLENLGLIIVDEEHETSYKQSDPSPRYHARDLAVARASLCGALCLLGSATPSIETMHNVRIGKYKAVYLTQRIASHGLPGIQLIDMRGRTEEEEILSSELLMALWERYEQKRQSILFLNRRGFATSNTCKQCGHILTCLHCSVALVYHRSNNTLRCHHCDYVASLPDSCPACRDKFITQRGFGTEKVAQRVEEKIPGIRVIRMDKDTTRRKGDHDRLLAPFRAGEADVLVGTQMIAKGLDFPNVTLVGIVNADYALSLPDFRAAERTFVLLTQVAGRAGRGTHAGQVVFQTHCPDHYSVQLALTQNYNAFFEKEIKYRRLIGFPPFSRLVLWRLESTNEDTARSKAWDLYHILSEGLKHEKQVTILPPVEAPLYRLRDYYRWQVALKSKDHKAFRPLLESDSLQKFMQQRRQGLRVVQDVDPWDML